MVYHVLLDRFGLKGKVDVTVRVKVCTTLGGLTYVLVCVEVASKWL